MTGLILEGSFRFGLAAYLSDDGNYYSIRIGTRAYDVARFGPAQKGMKPWPKHWKTRTITGLSEDGKRCVIPMPAENELYVSGGYFQMSGTIFKAYERTGERRPPVSHSF